MLRHKEKSMGKYRPTQTVFYELQKELEPYRVLYEKAKTIEGNFYIVLKQEEVKIGTYKVPENFLLYIGEKLEQYKSLPEPSKNVRCIETGQIFRNASEASKWAAFVHECYYCNSSLIKQACRGKQKTSYGYHWEFVKK